MLYRSTDRLCRRGAPMQNLAHSASFESLDKDAPSKAGTKHLAPRGLGPRRAPRRGTPGRPAPLEPIEGAIAKASQGRDVVGQKHEAERNHPEAENRQD